MMLSGLTLLTACQGKSAADTKPTIVVLKGEGATAPSVLYAKWIEAFRQERPNVDLSYAATGSGKGLRALQEGTVDFAGSDVPLTDEEAARMSSKPLHFPTVVGAIVPVYNVPGVGTLKFTGEALAGIFSGKIRRWDAPELASSNPGVKLPAVAIAVVHRADSSGSTSVFTEYLSKVSESWRRDVGQGLTVSWPVGASAEGNQGVAKLVHETPHAIGYVELNFALQEKLEFGEVRNRAGKFHKADFRSMGAAAAAAKEMTADFRISIVNPDAEAAYPICMFTWLIVPSSIPDSGKRAAMKDFLRWVYGPEQGIKVAFSTNYNVIHAPLLNHVKGQVDSIGR
jgi:phosphate transport system substrate-binding protein